MDRLKNSRGKGMCMFLMHALRAEMRSTREGRREWKMGLGMG